MNFINEEDNIAHFLYAGKHFFNAFFKFTAILAAGNHLCHIQCVDLRILKQRRHASGRDAAGQSLCQR